MKGEAFAELFKENQIKISETLLIILPRSLYLYFYLAIVLLPFLSAHSSALSSKHFMLHSVHIYPRPETYSLILPLKIFAIPLDN